MRVSFITAIGIALGALAGTRAPAQSLEGVSGPGRIVVTIRDSVSGDSLVRGAVCTSAGTFARCATETTGSRFVISDLPLGKYSVDAACETGRRFDGKQLGSVATHVADSTPVEVSLHVSFAGCDMRPLRRVSGLMIGHHMLGTETSRVSPCRPDEWYTAADSNRLTWLVLSERTRGPKAKLGTGSPIFFKDDSGRLQLLEGYEDFFVQAIGTLEGPGRFGPLGTSAFRFVVDSIVSIAPGSGGDCQRALTARSTGGRTRGDDDR